jgi:transcriptional regulator with XRE-family HTH domain
MQIAALRKRRNLSQAELAEIVGVEQPTISRIERGYEGVTVRLLRQIADALDCSMADLFADERSETENRILSAFRSLPAERQSCWLDMAEALAGKK